MRALMLWVMPQASRVHTRLVKAASVVVVHVREPPQPVALPQRHLEEVRRNGDNRNERVVLEVRRGLLRATHKCACVCVCVRVRAGPFFF